MGPSQLRVYASLMVLLSKGEVRILAVAKLGLCTYSCSWSLADMWNVFSYLVV